MVCPSCGDKLKEIPAKIRHGFGVVDDIVEYYYCPHCNRKMSLLEAIEALD